MRLAVPLVALALTACQGAMQTSDEPARATAQLQPSQGTKPVGEATFEDTGKDGVHLAVIVHGLKAGGEHGFALADGGDCTSPGAASAKGLPTLKANKSGTAKLDQTLNGMSVSGIVGHRLVVHASTEGNTGPQVACGVIHPG
jgi:Cu-Zn family superoxide dismutase